MMISKNAISGEVNKGASLPRVLTFSSLALYGTGVILGAGIYSLLGTAAGLVGPNLWLTFLLAAVCAGLTALSYCELATLKPKAGAEYNYLKAAFPRQQWLATTIGLAMAFAGTATAAAVSVAFGGYLSDFCGLPPLLSALTLLIVVSAINFSGLKESSRLNTLFTTIEIGGLLLFISIGFSSGFSIQRLEDVVMQPVSTQIFPATALVIFAYFGFEEIVNLVEETKNPSRNLPLAMIFSLALSGVIYLLVSFSALLLSAPSELASSSAPLMDAVKSRSHELAYLVGICALFSTANTVLVSLLAASRAFFGISKDGAFPPMFAKISGRTPAPRHAVALVLILSFSLLPMRSLELLANVSSLATLVGFSSVHISLIKLRYTSKELSRPFVVPGAIGQLPILPALGLGSTLFLITQFNLLTYLLGIGAMFGFFFLQYGFGLFVSKSSENVPPLQT